ncbi:Flp pilus assembly protein CpaB [Parvibaculum sp.]|uniref:Flp pilus assembly protein CpaB n=1 Tax=Parvibaculum sp. TaxID=2024848 RepID=UPI00320E6A52
MNAARMGVLILAVVAAGLAALLARGLVSHKSEKAEPVAAAPAVEVLVAASNIERGERVTAGSLRWQAWPDGPVAPELVTKAAKPNAIDQFAGSVARATLSNGEPIIETKLVSLDKGGFMSALIAPGMRAVAVPVAAETSAGGFILPNDHVDVILTHKVREGGVEGKDIARAETILRNVRVLAVDQRFKEEGDQATVGRTATLELSGQQVEVLAAAQVDGSVSLSLRSIAEADKAVPDDTTAKTESAMIRVVRYGAEKTVRVR